MTTAAPSGDDVSAFARARAALAGLSFRRVLREPLTHFLLIGLALFILSRFYDEQHRIYEITVTPAHVAQVARNYELQFGSLPDGPTLASLVDRDLHDEMLFREGTALGLGDDDEIVRRRIVQKMQFLMQDISAPAEPTDAQLHDYFARHKARYVTAPRVTFSHIYFSTDLGGDPVARAKAVLAKLNDKTMRAPALGDQFPDSYDYASYDNEQVERVFGRSPMVDAVFSAPVGHWAGPFRSGLGWHLIYVSSRQAAALPKFGAVVSRVHDDYLRDAQAAANDAAFAALARRFTVIREDKAPAR